MILPYVNFAQFRNVLRGTLTYLSYDFALCEFCSIPQTVACTVGVLAFEKRELDTVAPDFGPYAFFIFPKEFQYLFSVAFRNLRNFKLSEAPAYVKAHFSKEFQYF